MAARRPTVCATPGCPELTTGTYCPEHRKAQRKRSDRRRPNSSARGYGTRWARNKAAYLVAFPWCIDCGRPSQVPDHDPLERKELVRRGDPDPDAWHHLKPRCIRCHNRRTAQQHGAENAEAARLSRLS